MKGPVERRPLGGLTVLFAAGLTALLLLVGWPAAALAHANLMRSTPAASAVLEEPPTEVRLRFSEPPEPQISDVQVIDRWGTRTAAPGTPRPDLADDATLVVPLAPLEPGIYTVAWRVTSAVDGHVSYGTFAFAVGRDTIKPAELRAMFGDFSSTGSGTDPPLVVSRWLAYLATAMLVGGIAFYPAVLRPAVHAARRSVATSASEGPSRDALMNPAESPPSLPFALLYVAWGMAVAALLAGAVFQSASSAGADLAAALGTPLNNLVRGTRYGALLWLRLVLLVLLGAWLAVGQSQASRRHLPAWWSAAALGLGALLLLVTSAGSHAAAPQQPGFSLWANWLHHSAASVWVGGLVLLALAVPAARRSPRPLATALPAQLVGHFSQIATACVLVIALTGAYRAVYEVADPNYLLETTYGSTLLVKLALILPLLGLAAANLLVVRRRLATGAEQATWTGRLRWTVAGEIIVVAALLAATATLSGTPPSRDAFGSGLVQRAEAGGMAAILAVNPGEVGANAFEVYVRDSLRRPVTNADKVAVILTPPDPSLGQTEVVASHRGDGRYAAEGDYLSLPGFWRAQVLVRLPGYDDVRLDFTLSPRTPTE